MKLTVHVNNSDNDLLDKKMLTGPGLLLMNLYIYFNIFFGMHAKQMLFMNQLKQPIYFKSNIVQTTSY